MEAIERKKLWSPNGRKFDPWHSMCSYLGAFPPSLANYFITNFSSENDLVFDPFSGRGTTLLEARLLNRKTLATDLNPIALALSKAKNQDFQLEEAIERIDQLEKRYDKAFYLPEAKSQSDEIHLIYHPRTLAQLCYFRRKIVPSDAPIDHFLVGMTLGIMHGAERKDGSSGYASISMPNTFSMSPEYVRKFVQQKRLNREFRDVFQLLREKVTRSFKGHKPILNSGSVFEADAKKLSKIQELKPFIGKVKLLLTSPPYLGIVNYAKQNWIRSWLFDVDPNVVHDRLDDDLSLNGWFDFMKAVIGETKKFLAEDGVAIFVIGDVAKSKNSVIPLARDFALMCKNEALFENVWVISDHIGDGDKTTRIWGDTKGTATAVDRIVILSDSNALSGFPKSSNLQLESVENETRAFLR